MGPVLKSENGCAGGGEIQRPPRLAAIAKSTRRYSRRLKYAMCRGRSGFQALCLACKIECICFQRPIFHRLLRAR
ncbi:conserved hypothetical protein, partial [Ricinus communis]